MPQLFFKIVHTILSNLLTGGIFPGKAGIGIGLFKVLPLPAAELQQIIAGNPLLFRPGKGREG